MGLMWNCKCDPQCFILGDTFNTRIETSLEDKIEYLDFWSQTTDTTYLQIPDSEVLKFRKISSECNVKSKMIVCY